MRVFIKVKPNSNENKVIPPPAELFAQDQKKIYTVCVKEPPVDGKANDAVIRELANFFSCTRFQIKLISGAASRSKVFNINI